MLSPHTLERTTDQLERLLLAHKLLIEMCRRDRALIGNIIRNVDEIARSVGIPSSELQLFVLQVATELQSERLESEAPTMGREP